MEGSCVATPLPAACEAQVKAQGPVVPLLDRGSVPAAALTAMSEVTHGTQLPGSFLQTEVAKLQSTLSSMATSFPLLCPLSLTMFLLLLNFVFSLCLLCLRSLALMPWLLLCWSSCSLTARILGQMPPQTVAGIQFTRLFAFTLLFYHLLLSRPPDHHEVGWVRLKRVPSMKDSKCAHVQK